MKMKFTLIIAVAIIIGIVFAAGCTSTPENNKSQIPTNVAYTINVTTADNQPFNVGDILAIQLPSNPTTGYQWNVTEGSDILYKEFNNAKKVYSEDNNSEMIAGAPIVETFWFQPNKEGDYKITLKYLRSWEVDKPVSTLSFTLHVIKTDCPNADGPKLTLDYSSFNINPKAGLYVKIVTKGNPTTGYTYTPSGDGLSIIQDYNVTNPSLSGSPGQYNWYVKADKAGEYLFKASFKHAGTPDEISNISIPLKFN